MLMNAASAMVAVTMGALTQWEAMSASVHLERNYTGIKRTVLVSEYLPFGLYHLGIVIWKGMLEKCPKCLYLVV